MNSIRELTFNQLIKMWHDKSLVVGSVSSLTTTILPNWILANHTWSLKHSILIFLLFGVLMADLLVELRLANKSTSSIKDSEVWIDSLIRDVIMSGICAAAYGLDFLFETGSILFVFTVVAFIYHNFYSILANVVVLGWGNKFPLWLFLWLKDEIKLKSQKYFPASEVEKQIITKIKKSKHSKND